MYYGWNRTKSVCPNTINPKVWKHSSQIKRRKWENALCLFYTTYYFLASSPLPPPQNEQCIQQKTVEYINTFNYKRTFLNFSRQTHLWFNALEGFCNIYQMLIYVTSKDQTACMKQSHWQKSALSLKTKVYKYDWKTGKQ